jgi:hypothetical protein
MTSPKVSVAEASKRFIQALADYQHAVRAQNLAVQRLHGHMGTLYRSLRTVVDSSAAVITPPR